MEFNNNLKTFVVSLIGRSLQRGWLEGWVRFGEPLQYGWPDELKQLFMQLSQSMVVRSDELQNTLAQWHGLSFSQFWGNIIEMSVNNDPIAMRWEKLDARLCLSPEEIALLALMVTIFRDWPILRALRYVMSEQTPGQPRWGFVTHFLSGALNVSDIENALYPQNSILFQSGIIRFKNPDEPCVAAAELVVSPQVVDYLTNPEEALVDHLDALPLKTADAVLKPLIKRISGGATPQILVEGATGAGKTRIAQIIASKLKRSGVTLVDLSADIAFDQATKHIANAIALAVLKNDALVMQKVTKWSDRWNDGILQLAQTLRNAPCPVIWLVTGDKPAFLDITPECCIRIPMPNRSEREKYWKALLADKLNDKWIEQLAGQFLLTHGQIEDAVRNANALESNSEEALYKNVASEARALSKEGLGSLATPEPARVAMSQLIVSKECATALEDLLMYAKHRQELAKEWGFERSMPYGLGLAALFCGPPGTGKTYGAQVIATELHLELYRVDLSQLVSKYIGETEKHLAELFNAAEQGEILLLFDEADSIFGKRTEVKTSTDRYANLEINYLLQRLERFSGVSVLTSNFESGIDEAFMRRIRFKVPFELPEKRSRLILWNKFLSPAIPRADDVDISALAELYELSGGHIKEAVLRAASIAYGRPDKCVTQELLVSSAELEYKKLGKLLPYRNEDEDRSHWN